MINIHYGNVHDHAYPVYHEHVPSDCLKRVLHENESPFYNCSWKIPASLHTVPGSSYESQLMFGRQLTNNQPLTDCRLMIEVCWLTVGQKSVNCWPTFGGQSVNSRPMGAKVHLIWPEYYWLFCVTATANIKVQGVPAYLHYTEVREHCCSLHPSLKVWSKNMVLIASNYHYFQYLSSQAMNKAVGEPDNGLVWSAASTNPCGTADDAPPCLPGAQNTFHTSNTHRPSWEIDTNLWLHVQGSASLVALSS